MRPSFFCRPGAPAEARPKGAARAPQPRRLRRRRTSTCSSRCADSTRGRAPRARQRATGPSSRRAAPRPRQASARRRADARAAWGPSPRASRTPTAGERAPSAWPNRAQHDSWEVPIPDGQCADDPRRGGDDAEPRSRLYTTTNNRRISHRPGIRHRLVKSCSYSSKRPTRVRAVRRRGVGTPLATPRAQQNGTL